MYSLLSAGKECNQTSGCCYFVNPQCTCTRVFNPQCAYARGVTRLQLSCPMCLSVCLSVGANLRTGASRRLTEGTSSLSGTF